MGYYRKRKHDQYHQETKGIVRHVFNRWYWKGKSLLKHINTQRAQAPQPAWEEWEEQADGIWQRSVKRMLEAPYRTVKEEIRQYVAKPLGTHQWGVAIMYREAISDSRQGRSREEDTTEPPGTVKKWKLR